MPSELDEAAVKDASLGIATEPRIFTSVRGFKRPPILGMIDVAEGPG